MLIATPAEAFGFAQHPLTGAVSVSGVHDLRPLTLFSYNADFKLDDAEAARLSPSLHRPATAAPILIAVGGDETNEFLRQSEVLWDAWSSNRPADATGRMVIAGRHHFSVIVDYAEVSSALTRATLALF